MLWVENSTSRITSKGREMTDEEITSLKTKLAQPHRVNSTRVLYATCRVALAYIEELETASEPKRRGRPAKMPVTASPPD
jgi:hypothetical protein